MLPDLRENGVPTVSSEELNENDLGEEGFTVRPSLESLVSEEIAEEAEAKMLTPKDKFLIRAQKSLRLRGGL